MKTKNQDGKPVARTKFAILVLLVNYFFFLPAFFLAFFLAAMQITSLPFEDVLRLSMCRSENPFVV
jgi:hypothetical protein